MQQHCSRINGEGFLQNFMHHTRFINPINTPFRLFSTVCSSNNENREIGYCQSKTFQLLVLMILLT